LVKVLKVIDALWFKMIDGVQAFSTASAKLLRSRRFRSNDLGHAQSEIRKPFDVLAEGPLSKNSRGDRTAIELFVAGVRGWGSWRWRQLENSQST
jgi:hypothetical protein